MGELEWIVLGSGTAISRGPRTAAAHAARVGTGHVLFDSGTATLLRMGEAGIRFERLTDVFYTHLHPDHTADLVPLLFARNNAREEPVSERLTLWGPADLEAALDGLRRVYGKWIEPRDYRLEVRDFPGQVDVDGWRATAREMDHVPGALGYRLEASGRTVGYSGDTGYCAAVVELVRGADLAVLDCSFPDERAVPGHLTPTGCGRVAREAGVRRLLLTHLYPDCEALDVAAQAALEFDGEILVGHDLLRVEV